MRHAIIILHGWGRQGSAYRPLAQLLKNSGYSVYTPDLAGFGDVPLENPFMTLSDYVEFVNRYIKKNNIEKTILIGHSFGGRVGLKYAWRYPKGVDKLILTGVPIIRHMSVMRKTVYFVAISLGMLLRYLPSVFHKRLRKSLYFLIGEWDYYKSGPLKNVFKNIINEDLLQYAHSVTVPTLLVWGEEDRITPVSDIARIKRAMPHAESRVVPGVGHKLPYEKPEEFFEALKAFL